MKYQQTGPDIYQLENSSGHQYHNRPILEVWSFADFTQSVCFGRPKPIRCISYHKLGRNGLIFNHKPQTGAATLSKTNIILHRICPEVWSGPVR